jgi:hypothetical protein
MTASCDNLLTIVSTVSSILLILSEVLPYASSCRCNSITEAFSHLLCKNNCLISNKQIVADNQELSKVVFQLQNEVKNLTTVRNSIDVRSIVCETV